MKKILLIFAIALVSCETKNVTITNTDTVIAGRTIKTYVIEGCEYIGSTIQSDNAVLTHKGSCKSCRENLRKEIQSLNKLNVNQ